MLLGGGEAALSSSVRRKVAADIHFASARRDRPRKVQDVWQKVIAARAGWSQMPN